MNKAEADALALELKGLIPTMTKEQVVKAAEILEPADLALGRETVDSYVELYSEFSVELLRERLRLTQWRNRDPQAEERRKYARWEQEAAEIQRTLTSLDEAERARLVREVIAEQDRTNPFLAARLRRNPDPITNGVLAGLVVNKAKASPAVSTPAAGAPAVGAAAANN